jgi:hypothetical protein
VGNIAQRVLNVRAWFTTTNINNKEHVPMPFPFHPLVLISQQIFFDGSNFVLVLFLENIGSNP